MITKNDLYALLGVAPTIGVEQLRHAYVSEVDSAVQNQDFRRVLALSDAFGALPKSRRSAVFSAPRSPASPPQPDNVYPMPEIRPVQCQPAKRRSEVRLRFHRYARG